VLHPKKEFKYAVQDGLHHFFFVVNGNLSIYTNTDGKEMNPWDCFGMKPTISEMEYTLVAGKEGAGVLMITDADLERLSTNLEKLNKEKYGKAGKLIRVEEGQLELPNIVNAFESTEWQGHGINTTKTAHLCDLTDLKKDSSSSEECPWIINIECLIPGTRQSRPLARSLADEFLFVLAGKARYWYHGDEPEEILIAGDCIGWRAGTGASHCIINDGDGAAGQGKLSSSNIAMPFSPRYDTYNNSQLNRTGAMLVVLKILENKSNDKVYYPKIPTTSTAHEAPAPMDIDPPTTGTGASKGGNKGKATIWRTPPKYSIGGASHMPHFPRPADRSYPVWETKSAPEPAAARRAMAERD
jgi:mannose-6-phosphate isomerase-like protein (cupin superfamily)